MDGEVLFNITLSKPTCSICNQSVAINKEFNIKCLYETKHLQFSEYRGQIRKDKINHLKLCLEKQCSTVYFKNKTLNWKKTLRQAMRLAN